jgi:hypothetical protein
MVRITEMKQQSTPNTLGDEIEQVEELSGCRIGWLANKKIMVVITTNSKRATIDAWATRSTEIRSTWPADQAVYVLLDLTSDESMLTPYLRTRSQQVLDSRPEITTYLAMYVNRSLMANMLAPMLRRSDTAKTQMRMVFDYHSAIDWFKGMMEASKTMPKKN